MYNDKNNNNKDKEPEICVSFRGRRKSRGCGFRSCPAAAARGASYCSMLHSSVLLCKHIYIYIYIYVLHLKWYSILDCVMSCYVIV